MRAQRDAISGLQDHIGFWMRMVSNQVSSSFARKLQQSGVTAAEWVMLRELYGREAATPSDVAGALGMTRGAISKLLDRLVEKKLVSRAGRDDDRRYQDVCLTAKGVRVVPGLAALADRNDEEFFAPLTSGERAELRGLLEKLASAHDLRTAPTN